MATGVNGSVEGGCVEFDRTRYIGSVYRCIKNTVYVPLTKWSEPITLMIPCKDSVEGLRFSRQDIFKHQISVTGTSYSWDSTGGIKVSAILKPSYGMCYMLVLVDSAGAERIVTIVYVD